MSWRPEGLIASNRAEIRSLQAASYPADFSQHKEKGAPLSERALSRNVGGSSYLSESSMTSAPGPFFWIEAMAFLAEALDA